MPQDENNETLQVQGMRQLPVGQPFENGQQGTVPIEQPAAPRTRGPGRPKTAKTPTRRGGAAKAASNDGASATEIEKKTRKRGRQKIAVNEGMQTFSRESGSFDDEFAEFTQLDEENKRLRKMLADKLRQENAELRKRLQLD